MRTTGDCDHLTVWCSNAKRPGTVRFAACMVASFKEDGIRWRVTTLLPRINAFFINDKPRIQ